VNNVKQTLVTLEGAPLVQGQLEPKGSLSWFPYVVFVAKHCLWETGTTGSKKLSFL